MTGYSKLCGYFTRLKVGGHCFSFRSHSYDPTYLRSSSGLVVAAIGGVTTFAVARAEPELPAVPAKDQMKQLRRRVEHLEARVAELKESEARRIIPPEEGPGACESCPKKSRKPCSGGGYQENSTACGIMMFR